MRRITKSVAAASKFEAVAKRRARILYALPILLAVGTALPAMADDAQSHVAKAKADVDKGNFAAAEIELRNAARLDTDNPTIRLQLAEVYLKLGNLPAAEAEARLAKTDGAEDAADPPLAEALLRQNKFQQLFEQIRPGDRPADREALVRFNLGSAYINIGKYKEAEPLLRDAERLDEKGLLPKLGMARWYIGARDFASAEEELARAREIAPDDPRILRLAADLSLKSGKFEAAGRQLDDLLAKNPNDVAARVARAEVYIDLNQFDLALPQIDRVLAADKKNAPAMYLKAFALFKQHKLPEADALLTNIGSGFTSFPDGYFLAGSVKYALGQYEQAYEMLSKYLSRRPDNVEARRLVASIALRRRDMDAVIAALSPVVEKNPADTASVSLLAQAYYATNQKNKALELYQRAVAAKPGDSSTQVNLAYAELQSGELRTGEADLEQAAREAKPDSAAPEYLVVSLMREGKMTEAASTAEAAIKQNGSNVIARNLLGLIRLQQENYAAAEKIFKDLLAESPNLRSVRRNLAQVYVEAGRKDDARTLYQQMLKQRPDDIDAIYGLANLAISDKRTDEADGLLERASNALPKDPFPGVQRVELALSQKNWDKALRLARDLERRFPNYPNAYDLAAQALIGSGDVKGAASEYEKVTHELPDNAAVFVQLANFQVSANEDAAARTSLQKALLLSPGDRDAMEALINYEYKKGGPAAALREARSFIPQQPVLATLMTAKALLHLNRVDDAILLLDEAQQKNHSSSLLLELAQVTAASGKPQKAHELLQAWLKDNPQDGWARVELADLDASTHDLDGAIANYEIAYKQNPDSTFVINNLAALYGRKGDPRGRELADRAYFLSPNPQTEDTLGWLMVKAGDVQEGLPLLDRAARAMPDDPAIGFHLAYALKASGEDQRARAVLEGALKTNEAFDERDEAKKMFDSLKEVKAN
ncbi:MAG TPA: XrtA/PEP-CTERM system TPR-repeat protein PrsT [Stellaceae bacterium]|nr:XrtA/PEP-CTERM system TPR-repeat protein PrsT [Stellaceae bacterium]